MDNPKLKDTTDYTCEQIESFCDFEAAGQMLTSQETDAIIEHTSKCQSCMNYLHSSEDIKIELAMAGAKNAPQAVHDVIMQEISVKEEQQPISHFPWKMVSSLAAGIVILISLTTIFSPAPSIPTPTAHISSSKGQLVISPTTSEQSSTEISLNQAFSIKGDKKSYLDLILPQGHKVRFKPGSYMLSELGASNSITILSGTVYVTAKKLTNNQYLKVLTNEAVISVKGTQFFVQQKEHKTYLCVCEGLVKASSRKSPADIKMVSAGKDLYIHKEKPLEAPIDSPGMVDMAKMTFDMMAR